MEIKSPMLLASWAQNVLLLETVIKTIMIYTHVLNHGGRGVRSPLDDV